MAGNDHPDFSKPVMVGCILGLPDAENHLDSILGKLEPFCTLSALSRELAARRPADYCSMSSPSDSSGRLRTRVSAGGSRAASSASMLANGRSPM